MPEIIGIFDSNDDEDDGNYLQRLIASQTTKEKTAQLLDELESSGYRWLITVRGYQQLSKPMTRAQYLVGISLDILGIITILKGVLIVLFSNTSIRLLLGDLFIGSQADTIQVSLITMLLAFSVGLRLLGFRAERRGVLKSLHLYHQLKVTQFDLQQFTLTTADNSNLRKAIYLFGQFYRNVAPSNWIGLAAWLLFVLIANRENYNNLFTMVVLVFWTFETIFVFTLAIYPCIWWYIHVTMIISFATFSSNSIRKYGHSLIECEHDASHQDIFKYIAQQNRLYNLINLSMVDMGQKFCYGLLVTSGTANFAFFVSIFIGTGSNLSDSIILNLGMMAFSATVSANVLASFAVRKISRCRLMNYKIARRCKLDLHTNLKLLFTVERMNLNQIGFTLGGIIPLDSEHFAYYLAENAALMLMFITNFKKATSNY